MSTFHLAATIRTFPENSTLMRVINFSKREPQEPAHIASPGGIMPLKIDDLKTVENYKKAIKQDLTKISEAGNTKFWIYKDIELPTASGGKQKLPALICVG